MTPDRFTGLELLASSVLLVDKQDRVRYANPAAENMLDASLKSLSRQIGRASCRERVSDTV